MSTDRSSKTIYIVAAIILDQYNQLLLVRKKGSAFFMQAGGKTELNETPLMTLKRELKEELTLDIQEEQCIYQGHFEAPAANESGYKLDAHVFQLQIPHREILPHAEIEEIVWCDIAQAKALCLAPLTKDTLIPLVEQTRHIR